MAEKIQNSFYLLEEEINIFNPLKHKYQRQSVDFIYLIKHFKSKNYKEQPLKAGISHNYDIKLFYKRGKTEVKWKDFISAIAEASADILKFRNCQSESYILILYNKASQHYFATTGGYGHSVIQDITTNDFGIQILSRIVKAEDKALRATKERSFTGGVQGSVKFFRNGYNFYDNESFGSIYNELNASLDKQKLITLFGFSITDLRSDSLCIAKNSFSLKKSVSFKELLRIIDACEKLLKKPPIVEVNTVVKINKTNSALISTLNKALNQKIFANYKKKDGFFSVEIGHKDFERYFQSSYTKLSIRLTRKLEEFEYEDPIRDIQTIIDKIRFLNSKLSEADFNKVIEGGIIETFDSDGNILTSDRIRNHYCTEIKQGLKTYFLIEKDWYEVSKTMIDKINETCTAFITDKKYTGPLFHKWDVTHSTENDFNASYIGIRNSLVFDRITPHNIEVCDILRWDDDNIYLYHVKKGFDNSMRDLCSQVAISARKVVEDSKNNYSFLKSLYETLKGKTGKSDYIKKAKRQLNGLSKTNFIKLFEDRRLVFVLAVLDTSKGVRKLENDMKFFESNIAKFSLNELAKTMRGLDVQFKVLQIDK